MAEGNCANTTATDITEITFLDVLLIIAENKKIILITVLLFMLAGIVNVVCFNKVKYVSKFQIAPLMTSTIKNGDFNIQVSSGLVSGVLKSDAVLDFAVARNALRKKTKGEMISGTKARMELSKNIKCDTDSSSGIITVSVENDDPKRAQAIAASIYEGTLKVLSNTGQIVSNERDAFLTAEIKSSVQKLQEFILKERKKNTNNDELNEMLKTVALISMYDESASYRDQIPLVIQLVSPASLPDEHEPRGRAKIIALFLMFGLFVGLTIAFVMHFWKLASSDPSASEKVSRLQQLLGKH